MFKLFSAVIAMAWCLSSCNQTEAGQPTTSAPHADSVSKVKRGAYLVQVGGCNDCHSPKRMGPNGPEIIPETALSGYPGDRPVAPFDTALAKSGIAQFGPDMTSAAGPWGISFAANLTGDPTGAGSWPLENFKNALRHGKFKGLDNARPLLPPMPWFNYATMTDEDIAAVQAFLKSIKPVRNIAPAPIMFSGKPGASHK